MQEQDSPVGENALIFMMAEKGRIFKFGHVFLTLRMPGGATHVINFGPSDPRIDPNSDSMKLRLQDIPGMLMRLPGTLSRYLRLLLSDHDGLIYEERGDSNIRHFKPHVDVALALPISLEDAERLKAMLPRKGEDREAFDQENHELMERARRRFSGGRESYLATLADWLAEVERGHVPRYRLLARHASDERNCVNLSNMQLITATEGRVDIFKELRIEDFLFPATLPGILPALIRIGTQALRLIGRPPLEGVYWPLGFIRALERYMQEHGAPRQDVAFGEHGSLGVQHLVWGDGRPALAMDLQHLHWPHTLKGKELVEIVEEAGVLAPLLTAPLAPKTPEKPAPEPEQEHGIGKHLRLVLRQRQRQKGDGLHRDDGRSATG